MELCRDIQQRATVKKGIACLTALCCSAVLLAQTGKTSNAHVGLIYPISSNGGAAGQYTNRFSLHLIAGVSKAETGAIFSGVSSIIKDSAHGLQAAGFSNHIGNSAQGAQLAGFMNQTKHNVTGVQAAGFLNLAGSISGVQAAGFANLVSGNSQGIQASGFLNKAQDIGSQFSGFLNKAKKVKGVQVGFINIADSNAHPIGVVNIIKNGEKSIGVSVDETLTALISFRSGGRVLYGILGVGYNFDKRQNLYAFEAGIGAHWRFSERARLNAELVNLFLDDFKKGDYNRTSLRLLPAVKLGKAVEIFAGPTFNFIDFSDGKGSHLTPHYLWSKTSGNHFYALYFGATGGIQVNL